MSIEDQSKGKAPVDIKKVDYTLDWKNDNPSVNNLIGRTHSGTRVVVQNDDVRPYFYVPMEEVDNGLDGDDKVVDIEYGYESIYGEDMARVYTRIPGDVPKLRGDYSHHEADILFPNRFLIDSEIESSIEVPIEDAGPRPTMVALDDIDTSDFSQDSRYMFCDIEVDDSRGFPSEDVAKEKIVCITTYDSYEEQYDLWMFHPDTPLVSHDKARVHIYETEVDMMLAFCDYVRDVWPDVLAGWNFSDFDARYLLNRLDKLDEKNDDVDINSDLLSPLGTAYDEHYYGGKVKGISIFDMLKAYKTLQFTELDSYSLEDVAQAELDVGKIKDSRGIYELWQEDPQKLVDYNVKDVELTVRLEHEQDIIKFYEEIAEYVGGRLSEVVTVSSAVDIKVLRTTYNEYTVPSDKDHEDIDFEGGFVFDATTGLKENVVVLDLKSLYPMSMKTLNAGPDTKDPDGAITAPNGISFNNDEPAMVVQMIDEMLEKREKYKDLRNALDPESKQYKIYDRKQTAVKIVMNTLYGVMGWVKFRLYDKDTAAAVTATGREVIKHTRDTVIDQGYDVVYGDTDSVMIELDSDLSKEECKEIAFELEDILNEVYDEFAQEVLGADEHYFQIEFEKLYKRFLQAGSKKRYAGHIIWKEGKDVDKVDAVGFETNRSDYSKIAKSVIEDTLDYIVRGASFKDISDNLNEVLDSLKNGEYDPDIYGIPASIGKEFDEYDSPTTAVRAAQYANQELDARIQPGDKPKKMFIKRILPSDSGKIEYGQPPSTAEGEKFVCWNNFSDMPKEFQWDWDTYIDKQIRAPIKRILAGTSWTWEELINGNEHQGLDEFEFTQEESAQVARLVEEIDNEDVDTKDDLSPELRKQFDKAQEFLNNFDGEVVSDEEVSQFTIEEKEPDGKEHTLSDELKSQLSRAQQLLNSFEDDEEEFDEDDVQTAVINTEDKELGISDYL